MLLILGGGRGLNSYQISRQVDITPIITSNKFISVFRDSDYSIFDDWNSVKNITNNKYIYNLGYSFDSTYKKEIYNSFINDYKTKIENGIPIYLNNLCAHITDSVANLGSDFNLQSVTSKDELFSKAVGGRFASGTSFMKGYDSSANDISKQSFRKLFVYAAYYGCNIDKVSSDITWSRFRGYDRCLWLLKNTFRYLGYNFDICFRERVIKWTEVDMIITEGLGNMNFAQYLN